MGTTRHVTDAIEQIQTSDGTLRDLNVRYVDGQIPNMENGSTTGSVQMKAQSDKLDANGKFKFGTTSSPKNANAVSLDTTFYTTDSSGNILIPYGATSQSYASAFGGCASAQGKRSLAEGTSTVAKGPYSHAEGDNSVALGADSHAEGYATTTGPNAQGAHSEGISTQAIAMASHAEGSYCSAKSTGAHAEGAGTEANKAASHSEGKSTIADADFSHAEGESSTVKNESYTRPDNERLSDSTESSGSSSDSSSSSSSSSSTSSDVFGVAAHAEGFGSVAAGYASHAEGTKTIANGSQSHAEGYYTDATGKQAHSEGAYSQATGNGSHAEGYNSLASGVYAHSEGYNTKARGYCTHTGGVGSEADGAHSFAHGLNAKALHSNSFALGREVETTNDDSMVVGQWNANDKTLFAVGCGTSKDDRKNAFAINANGRAYISNGLDVVNGNIVASSIEGGSMTGESLVVTDSVIAPSLHANKESYLSAANANTLIVNDTLTVGSSNDKCAVTPLSLFLTDYANTNSRTLRLNVDTTLNYDKSDYFNIYDGTDSSEIKCFRIDKNLNLKVIDGATTKLSFDNGTGKLSLSSNSSINQLYFNPGAAYSSDDNLIYGSFFAGKYQIQYKSDGSFGLYSSDDKKFIVTAEGAVTAASYNTTSDRRIKENIEDYSCPKSILDLPIKKFDFIEGSKNQIGCLAQDLQKICPEIVHEGDDGYLSIQESKIVYLLLEEVKKLSSRVSKLEAFLSNK